MSNGGVVIATGPLATVQDLGRDGYSHLGVPRSGGADRAALRLANRLVGNRESAAVVEVTFGGLRVAAAATTLIAVSGAHTTVRIDGTAVGTDTAATIRAGQELSIAPPEVGCRNYVAIRGGIDVPAVLGSRSTDILSGLGPAPLAVGDELPAGSEHVTWPSTDLAPVDADRPEVTELQMWTGPRLDVLADPTSLRRGIWQVDAESNRVGVRIYRPTDAGGPPATHRRDAAELPSEGIPHGAIQVPPSGRPVIFLADHPVTGGYPVVGVLSGWALDRAAQLVAGDRIRFRQR